MKKNHFGIQIANIFILISSSIFGQQFDTENFDPNKELPPSPTVANLIDFSEVPVNNYTGQPNITIPLFSKQLNRDVMIDLSLGYSSSGVKIDNRSGWIGTGWSLSGLGTIAKTVRGIPDDWNNGIRVGAWHAPEIIEQNIKTDQKLQWMVNGEDGKRWDSQYDLFQAAYPGGTVEFYVKTSTGGLLVPVITKMSSPVKIHLGYDISSGPAPTKEECEASGNVWLEERSIIDCSSFPCQTISFPAGCLDSELIELDKIIIIDTQGIRYEFGVFEYTEAIPVNAVLPQNYHSPTGLHTGDIDASGVNEIYRTRSAWHLTKIYSSPSANSELLSVTYSPSTEAYLNAKSRTTNTIDFNSSPVSSDALENNYNIGIFKPYKVVSYFSNITTTLKPSMVEFKDGTSINFNFNNNLQHPETNGAVLGSIDFYKTTGAPSQTITFNHDVSNERLWLLGFEEYNTERTLQHETELGYHNRTLLPPFDSPKDIWGYIDQGDGSATGKSYDPIQTGLLSYIKYPTGGKKEFKWEQHRFSYAGDELVSVSGSNENPNNWSLRTSNVNFNGTTQAQGEGFVLHSETINLPDHRNAKVRLIDLSSTPAIDPNNTGVRIKDASGNILFNSDIQGLQQYSYVSAPGLTSGTLTVELYTPDITTYTIDFQLRVEYEVYVSSTNNSDSPEYWIYGGGPRIKEVSFTDKGGIARRWNYDYSHPDTSSRSSGVIDGTWDTYKPVHSRNVQHFIFPYQENSGFAERTIRYTIENDLANVKQTHGSYVGYSRVKVTERGRGYTVYNYTSPQDTPSGIEEFKFPFHQKNNDYSRGLLLSEISYEEFIVKDSVDESTSLPVEGPEQGENLGSIQISKWLPVSSKVYAYNTQSDLKGSSYLVTQTEACGSLQFYTNHETNQNRSMMVNCPPNLSGSFTICDPDLFGLITCDLPYKVTEIEHTEHWNKLTEKTIKQFSYDEWGNQKKNEQIINYSYNANNRLVSTEQTNFNEGGIVKSTFNEYTYSGGPLPLSSGYFTEAELDNINTNAEFFRIADPVLLKNSIQNGDALQVNSKVIKEAKFIYNNEVDGVYELSTVSTRKNNGFDFESEFIIHKVDKWGNIIDFTGKDGIRKVHLYGFNGSKLIAEIVDKTYNEIMSSSPNTIDANWLEGTSWSHVKAELIKIRENLGSDNSLMTSYIYDSELRLSEIHDPNGAVFKYFYDDFGRLQQVIDNQGNVVKEHTYHLRNQ